MIRDIIKLGYWKAVEWLCSDTGLSILAVAAGALLWVNYWVSPHDQFLDAIAGCMREKGDTSSPAFYTECVDLVQTRK